MCAILSSAIPLSDFNISKIHVLYIVNLVRKRACRGIEKMQKRGTRKLCSEKNPKCLFYLLYCSVDMIM